MYTYVPLLTKLSLRLMQKVGMSAHSVRMLACWRMLLLGGNYSWYRMCSKPLLNTLARGLQSSSKNVQVLVHKTALTRSHPHTCTILTPRLHTYVYSNLQTFYNSSLGQVSLYSRMLLISRPLGTISHYNTQTTIVQSRYMYLGGWVGNHNTYTCHAYST